MSRRAFRGAWPKASLSKYTCTSRASRRDREQRDRELARDPLRFDVPAVKKPVVEECRLELVRDQITIEFPSGNRMGFRRSER
jgi:hypothetical protein